MPSSYFVVMMRIKYVVAVAILIAAVGAGAYILSKGFSARDEPTAVEAFIARRLRLLAIPRPLLYGGILLFAGLGTYTLNNSTLDLVILYLVGVVGFVMRRFGFPVAPAIIGLILGPLAEQQLRRALAISQGDVTVLFTSPIAATLLTLAALALIVPMILRARGRGAMLTQMAADSD